MVGDIIEALKGYRIVDLSVEIHPNVLKVNGEYIRGNQVRRFNIEQFINAEDGTYMHFLEAESHIGTHIEGPSHLRPDLKPLIEIPLEKFIGEATVLKFEANTSIKAEHLQKIKEGDIVLLWSSGGSYVTREAAKYLADKRIKMLGLQGVHPDEPGSGLATHRILLENDIPIIEGLINLDRLKSERVFFIGLPLKIANLDSSWIRAIALEPVKYMNTESSS
ncbi:MAG: cyclase family protein [Nitrososphaerota archaeon]|nr:cyclase family protein [Candidatus Bathyarchaeota archaeon]MDW8061924.1 cyclase family protein [Nitrososphaerota archaeon]